MIRCHELLGTRADATDAEMRARLKRVRVLLHPDRHSSLGANDLHLLRGIVAAAEGATEAFTAYRHDGSAKRVQKLLAQMRACPRAVAASAEGSALYECRVRVGADGVVERVACTRDGRRVGFQDWLAVQETCRKACATAARSEGALHGDQVPRGDADASADEDDGENAT